LFSLGRGDRLVYGDVTVEYGVDGRVEACDSYGCHVFRVSGSERVTLNPVPPLHRPRPLSACLYLALSEPVVARDGVEVSLSAPFELEVRVGSIVVGYLSPTRAKYTLVGDVVDGVICRFYRSKLASSGAELGEGEGLVNVRFRGLESLIPAVAFYAAGLSLDVRDGVVWYPPLEASISRKAVSVRVSGRHILAQAFVMEV
jgi:hypothetical protein